VSAYLSVAVLLLFAGCLLLFPLIPSLVELRRKSDAQPLNVIQQHAGEIRHFANGFRNYLGSIQGLLQQCVSSQTTARGVLPDGCEYLILGRFDGPSVLPIREKDSRCDLVIVSGTELATPAGANFAHEIYAAEQFIGGDDSRYRAILGEKRVHLGPRSRLSRWIHAAGSFTADNDCRLFGRVSSDGIIRLAAGNEFLRLNAPRIEFGTSELAEQSCVKMPDNLHTRIVHRLLCDTDYEIGAGQTVNGSVVARGRLIVGAGARVCGSVKGQETILQSGAVVEGSVISSGKMQIGSDCSVHGPVIAEREIRISAGAQCGSAAHPTTISSPRIKIEEGVMVFGTVWAREAGRVVTAS
jgi:cytoskeletal protein CcmA (bactofilin family)